MIAALPAMLGAQGAATGVVAGAVTTRPDSGAAIGVTGATVSIVSAAIAATTAADGSFVLSNVPAGRQVIRVRRAGYRSLEREVAVAAADTVRVDIVLQPDAQRLAPVHTVARSPEAVAFASKPDVGTITMSAAAIAGVPSAGEPDVIRVAQLLPGVVARNDFNTGLDVRGGEPDQNLILLDGYPLYNPFHLGGLTSTFMDATVGGIELFTGAYPARFGGRLSSVLDVSSAEEKREGVHASVDISALGATGRMSGALGGERGSWSIAGRRTYADALASVFTNNVFPYHFHDLHGHATYSLPARTRLTVTAYEGRDVLDANLAEFRSDSSSRAGAGTWAFNWGNRLLGATVTKQAGEHVTLEQRVSLSGFSTLLDIADGARSQRSTVNDLTVSGSVVVAGAAHDRTLGYELATQRIRYESGSAQTGTTDFDLVQHPGSAALWIDDLWRVSPRWIVEGGVRGETLRDRKWAGVSPRLSVKYFLRPELALTAAAARVTQSQHSLAGDGPLRYFEIWIASDSMTPVASAWHWLAGAERRLGDVGTVKLEGFYKRYDRVLEANPSEDPARHGDEFFVNEGSSYGADLLVRVQPATGIGGWLAYTYGVSARWRDSLRWAPGHDRRHDLNVVATWRLTKYRLGARLGFATGTPYTPIVGEIARRTYDPSTDHWGTGDPQRPIESIGGARNSARFPATERLDLDASRVFRFHGATVAPYVSVLNTFNSKNIFVYLYRYSINPPTRRAYSQFPILPSLGVRVDF